MIDEMAIKDQVSATEQMKKIDDIQESHMVGGWGQGEVGGVGKKGSSSLVPRLLEASVSSSPPKSLVTRLRKGVLGSTDTC